MKVLNVSTTLDPMLGGGEVERTVQISQALHNAGVDVSIMTTDAGLDLGKHGDSLRDIRIIAFRCILRRFFIPLLSISKMWREISRVDVVHIIGHWSLLYMLVYFVVRMQGKPYVVCPAGSLPIFGRSKMIKKIYNVMVGNGLLRNASAWVAITDDERAQFEPYGVKSSDVTVIPNGVCRKEVAGRNVDTFRSKNGLGDEPFVLFMGRLNLIKGPDILLEAFCKGCDNWDDWHLVYAGPDGGMLEQLEFRAKELSCTKRIHFIGYVGGEDKVDAYRAAELLAIPSRQEAMSIVALESGILATPVLLTDQCGFDEIEDIGGGMVVPDTVEGIQKGLLDLTADRSSLAENGRILQGYVGDNYTWSVVIKKYLDLYSQILN